MRTDLRYTPSDCFETFPFPSDSVPSVTRWLVRIGDAYHAHRRKIMRARQEGLTRTYNRFHAPDVGGGAWRVEGEEFRGDAASDEAIVWLRHLHVEMDKAVAAAYGWSDLDLGHGFHETKQGLRFTISEAARREVLARLLKLNHERHAEEVAQGLHDTKRGGGRVKGGGKKTGGRKAKGSSEPSLFGDET